MGQHVDNNGNGAMYLSNNARVVILSVLIFTSSVVPSDAGDSGGFVSEFLQSIATGLVQDIAQRMQDLTAP